MLTEQQQVNVGTVCGWSRGGIHTCLPASDFLTPSQGMAVFWSIMLTAGAEGLGAILAAEADASSMATFADRAAARQAFGGDMQAAANRFFRGATSKSQDFQAQNLGNGRYQMQFFSPANNPGYGKLYVQVINEDGTVLSEYKDTLGPGGLIERKWITGGP